MWAKLDDGILDNPKIAEVGPIGFALHVAGITYCARNLTDGFVPRSTARRLLSQQWTVEDDEGYTTWTLSAHSGMHGIDGDEVVEHVIELLLNATLWEEVPNGYHIHDYLDYNPSKDEVLALRETRSEAGRLGGRRSARTRRKQANAQANGQAPPQANAQADAEANASSELGRSNGSSKCSSKTEAKPNPAPVPVPVDVPVPVESSSPEASLAPSPRARAHAREAPPQTPSAGVRLGSKDPSEHPMVVAVARRWEEHTGRPPSPADLHWLRRVPYECRRLGASPQAAVEELDRVWENYQRRKQRIARLTVMAGPFVERDARLSDEGMRGPRQSQRSQMQPIGSILHA